MVIIETEVCLWKNYFSSFFLVFRNCLSCI